MRPLRKSPLARCAATKAPMTRNIIPAKVKRTPANHQHSASPGLNPCAAHTR